jgi:hypothetical protein
MNAIRTSLQRAPREAITDDEKRALAKTAWHKLGPIDNVWACLRLGDVLSWEIRELIMQEMNRQHGRRAGR